MANPFLETELMQQKRSAHLTWLAVTALATLCLSMSPAAASVQIGKITDLLVRAQDGLIAVEIEGGPRAAKPPCATMNYWLIKAESSTTGKQQHATLLAAKLTGKSVRLVGSNQCTRWSDGEDIDSVQVLD
jgi:hypothetical protein